MFYIQNTFAFFLCVFVLLQLFRDVAWDFAKLIMITNNAFKHPLNFQQINNNLIDWWNSYHL